MNALVNGSIQRNSPTAATEVTRKITIPRVAISSTRRPRGPTRICGRRRRDPSRLEPRGERDTRRFPPDLRRFLAFERKSRLAGNWTPPVQARDRIQDRTTRKTPGGDREVKIVLEATS
jgi:hypothetical protein